MQSVVTILLWFASIGCGLIAGLYFAFSTFIMAALGRIEQAHGIAAMNSINATILGSLFMPLFFGTTLVSAMLSVLALLGWNEPGASAMFAGGLIYVVGMFGCTLIFNVPLNNKLARAGAAGADSAAVWSLYMRDWTFWNHVRTVASTIACGLFIAAISVRSGAL